MFALLSTSILAIMYFVVFILTTLLVYFAGIHGVMGLTISFIITLLFILLQFFLSPIVYDVMLRWVYRCNFVNVDDLPPSVADFVRKTFNEKGVRLPKIGIIDDYTPTAFTYGNFPSNARVIISKGLLDIMDEDEIKAVLAHEFGHIFHYDFVFMTLAAMIPILLYYIYRIALQMGRSSRRNGAPLYMVALVTLVIYIISEYIVLYLSRLREYYADKFAAYLTMNPSALATALIKVGYGLLENKYSGSDEEKVSFYKSPFKVLGLMDARQAKGISLAVLNSGVGALEAEAVSSRTDAGIMSSVGKVMAWDLFNPWASILELSSTHPLIAKRIRNLSQIAKELGVPFSIHLPKGLPKEEDRGIDLNPGSLWDEFMVDLFFQYAPLIGGTLGLIGGLIFPLSSNPFVIFSLVLWGIALGSLIKWFFTYRGEFREYKIAELLSRTKVSMIRSIPAIIRGRIMGKGIAGYALSEDVTFKDDTGFIYVDYRTGIGLADLAYGFFVTNNLIGKQATIKGYFRRAIFPYFEVVEIVTEDGKKYRSYYKYLWILLIFGIFLLGVITFIISLF